MPRTTLSDLSVELHFEILKYALYSSKSRHSTARRGCLIGRRIPRPIEWKWIEQDRHTLSQFPYNVAAVSRLWHSILTTIPECWTRVIIDVATDPHRFLDIFLWSKELPKLEVTIFNSRTADPKDAEHCALERERVSMIVKALRPHIYRCEYIKFDITFMTSLPSPVIFLLEDPPDLKELILECKIDNAGPPDVYARDCDLGARKRIKKYPTLAKLEYLSLTGFWFMFIAGHRYTQKLFKKITTNQFQCSISQFQFQKEGKYTLQNFVSYCSQLKQADLTTLRDLSLDHDGPILERKNCKERGFSGGNLTLKNVTPDVLQTLFFLANISPDSLTFENCTFPEAILPSRANKLTLENIPRLTPVDPEATNTTNLSSILKDWSGSSLSVKSCPSFDDDALTALSDQENPCLVDLCLSDCNNFTARGLQQYIERRNRSRISAVSMNYLSGGDSGRRPMETIKIDGTVYPFLSEEEEEWFQTSVYAERTTITWSGKNFRDQQLNKLLLSTID